MALDPGQELPFPVRPSPFPSILEISCLPQALVGHLSHLLYCLAGTHSNPQGRVRLSQRKGDIPGSCPLPPLNSKTLWGGRGSCFTQTNRSLSQQRHLCSKQSLHRVLWETPHRPLGMTSGLAVNGALGRCSPLAHKYKAFGLLGRLSNCVQSTEHRSEDNCGRKQILVD